MIEKSTVKSVVNKKNYSTLIGILMGFVWLMSATTVNALDINMVRVDQPFPETLETLSRHIKGMGYSVSRIQRVDYGLNKAGFKTDAYQIVFFGKYEEIHELTKKYPELIPFLPLKIVIFAEGMDTLLLANNYNNLTNYFNMKELEIQFRKWREDTAEIFSRVQLQQE